MGPATTPSARLRHICWRPASANTGATIDRVAVLSRGWPGAQRHVATQVAAPPGPLLGAATAPSPQPRRPAPQQPQPPQPETRPGSPPALTPSRNSPGAAAAAGSRRAARRQQVSLGPGGRAWTPLHAQLQRALTAGRLLREGAVLVAVSGGQDSVCLLRLLADLQPLFGWRLGVGHCDHRWRPDSAANAAFVADLAARHGLPCHTAVAPPGLPRSEGAARDWRYGALEHMARQYGYGAVVTAHTATDRAETLLLNLLRGSGPDGLVALAVERPLGPSAGAATTPSAASSSSFSSSSLRSQAEEAAASAHHQPHTERGSGLGGGSAEGGAVRLVRPLAGFSRAQTGELVARLGLEVYHDSTNDLNDIRRNRLRNEVLPMLRAGFNPRLDEALGRFLEVLEGDMALLGRLTEQAYQRAAVREAEEAEEEACPQGEAREPTGGGLQGDTRWVLAQAAAAAAAVGGGRAGDAAAGWGRTSRDSDRDPLASCSGGRALARAAGLAKASGKGAASAHAIVNGSPTDLASATTRSSGSGPAPAPAGPSPRVALSADRLAAEPLALQRRVVRRWLAEQLAWRSQPQPQPGPGTCFAGFAACDGATLRRPGSGEDASGEVAATSPSAEALLSGLMLRSLGLGCRGTDRANAGTDTDTREQGRIGQAGDSGRAPEASFRDVAAVLQLLGAPNRSNSDGLSGGLVASVRGGLLWARTPAEWAAVDEAERERERQRGRERERETGRASQLMGEGEAGRAQACERRREGVRPGDGGGAGDDAGVRVRVCLELSEAEAAEVLPWLRSRLPPARLSTVATTWGEGGP
ncbi:hypothetical protein HYH03_001377 [Edaphochlamys debaryana]|uniref:tRNA(Ile)-lysidine synthetase n=1 Tax=Edaphochlamys debaryana TaxID=47281 RepID=A0A835YCZ4_9CHLO|nr:hypothetical protein HYH03_001377 [Edaphochlamys debaryana]|eukprot:KAG2500610.1 hypothetical protein HYH03_001377 [Edaphochlamys debaryana]